MKQRKKLISLLLAVGMSATLLTGCGVKDSLQEWLLEDDNRGNNGETNNTET